MSQPVTTSATQTRVRDAIAALGGYWRPANAAIRLLEELGELAEHGHDGSSSDEAALANECADLWIISTALADQFYAAVAEPGAALVATADDGSTAAGDGHPATGESGAASGEIASLAAAAGRIGRIVNYYDGPKIPRTLDGWVSLEQAVGELHAQLAAFAERRGVDLASAVAATLDRNVAQDQDRFDVTYDPRTAAVLERFAAVTAGGSYPYPGEDRLFGAPDWKPGKLGPNVEALRAPLTTFLRAARPERLQGFVIGGPEAASLAASEAWAGECIRTLALGAAAMTTTTFSPFRPEGDARWAPSGPFLLLRSSAD